MTNEPTLPPPTTYESIVGEVDPGCHVYRTIVSAERRFQGWACLGATAFLVWMGSTFVTGPGAAVPFGYGFGAFFWLLGLVLLYVSISVVAYSTQVVITPDALRIERRWYPFQRNEVWVSDIRDVIEVESRHMLWAGRGPAPRRYTISLVFANGRRVSMQSSIYSLDTARALAADMKASIWQAIEQPDDFGTATLQAAR
jgi:hypothetical protein